MKKLTNWQLKAIGEGYSPLIWNQKVAKMYTKANFQNLLDDDETISQSFMNFWSMVIGCLIRKEQDVLLSVMKIEMKFTSYTSKEVKLTPNC